MQSQLDHGIDLIDVTPHEFLGSRFVRDFGRLFFESDTWLAVLDDRGALVCTSGTDGEHASIEDLLAGETVSQLQAVLADAVLSDAGPHAHDHVQVVRGRTAAGSAIELRIVPAQALGGHRLALVRPLAEAAADRARIRARQLSAALQAVADIVLPLEELQGHEEARRRAALVGTLTDRERLIALAVANGVRTSQIATDLFVSQSTIRNYLPTIYRKLGVRSRAGLVELLNASE